MTVLDRFRKLENKPLGKRIFSYLFCRRLPYFFSIRPLVLELESGRSVVQMKERRSVHNHIPTIHAIAQCNLCEAAMAIMTAATIPSHLRFIPVGMTVSYKRPARGTIQAVATVDPEDFKVGETRVHVDVYDAAKVNVMSAVIVLNIKEK